MQAFNLQSTSALKTRKVARSCAVKAVNNESFAKKASAAALVALVTLSSAAPMFADETEDKIIEAVKKRVCVENPTASICVGKRADWYELNVVPRLPKN